MAESIGGRKHRPFTESARSGDSCEGWWREASGEGFVGDPLRKGVQSSGQPSLLLLIGLERVALRVTTTTHKRHARKKERRNVKGIGYAVRASVVVGGADVVREQMVGQHSGVLYRTTRREHAFYFRDCPNALLACDRVYVLEHDELCGG